MEEKLLFGKYVIKGKLGQGGMAIVYHAFDPTLQRDIAIKALLPKFKKNVDVVRMFIREGQLMARLDDPHIVKVYENAKFKDFFFYVMEYINGKTLKQLMKRGMSTDENEVIFKEILRALSYIHEKEIIHLDLKPSNIMIENSGKIKITDFGIGVELNKDILKKDTLVGTIKYVAPEQIQGGNVGYHTDIYQLGIILYELYSGTVPFTGTNEEIMKKKVEEEPEELSILRPIVPDYISSVCMRMLRRDPADRYKTVEDVIDDLDNLKSYAISAEDYEQVRPAQMVEKVYTADDYEVPVHKKKKKFSFFSLFRTLILVLTILLFLGAGAIWQAERISNFPLGALFVDVKGFVIQNFGILGYNGANDFALWCGDHSEYVLAENVLLSMLERYPGRKYDIQMKLFDLYYLQDEEKFTATANKLLEFAPGSDKYFIFMKLGRHYKAKDMKKLSDLYFKKAIANAPSEELKSAVYKLMQ